MKRLMEYTVFSEFTTACRLAVWPTRRSPFLLNATTDGHSRPPSAVEITVADPPSMTDTTLLVVPRSIPMIFPIADTPCFSVIAGRSSAGYPGGRRGAVSGRLEYGQARAPNA